MRQLTFLAAALLLLAAKPGDAQRPPAPVPPGSATLEMVFVLDTTGSMGGMIGAAKQKIWSIVNDVLKSPHPPRVRVGLVVYRDHGDAYVTKVLPLTGDLDQVDTMLRGSQAGGGGDTPEDVRQSLSEGVLKTRWSPPRPHLAQVLFLVGDAPPHDDYKSEPDTCASADRAARAGITVNAIQCGNDPDTKAAWERIVRCGKGEYFQIAEDGGVQETPPTPFDAALGDLGTVMGGTYLPYLETGSAAAITRQHAREASVSRGASLSTLADRAVNKALNRDAYRGDLLELLDTGAVTLETLRPERLPASVRALPAPERRKALKRALENRRSVRQEILTLSRQRDAYLGRATPAPGSGGQKGLDEAVVDALRRQASKKGIDF